MVKYNPAIIYAKNSDGHGPLYWAVSGYDTLQKEMHAFLFSSLCFFFFLSFSCNCFQKQKCQSEYCRRQELPGVFAASGPGHGGSAHEARSSRRLCSHAEGMADVLHFPVSTHEFGDRRKSVCTRVSVSTLACKAGCDEGQRGLGIGLGGEWGTHRIYSGRLHPLVTAL